MTPNAGTNGTTKCSEVFRLSRALVVTYVFLLYLVIHIHRRFRRGVRGCWIGRSFARRASERRTLTSTMRAVVQRVSRASVTMRARDEDEGENEPPVTRVTGRGLVVLVCVEASDDDDDMAYIARKVFNTKLWPDASGKPWCASAREREFDVLFVSQFTLCAELKGNKPSFHRSAAPERAKTSYDSFLAHARAEYASAGNIESGDFGAMMDVDIQNDGPVTLILDSKNRN